MSETNTTPPPSRSAVSTESASRDAARPPRPLDPVSVSVCGCHHQAIHHRLDGVVLVAVEFGRILDLEHLAVDAHAHEAGLAHVLEDRLVLALAIHDQRRQDQQPAALRVFQHAVHDLLHGLLR